MRTVQVVATLFWWLMVSHAVADWTGLQGDFLSRAKNVAEPILGVPPTFALLMHALIHAGGVQLVTQSWVCAVGELVLHTLIDWAKCWKMIDFSTDQLLHVLCKGLWIMWVIAWL